jgi:hypothetical protein
MMIAVNKVSGNLDQDHYSIKPESSVNFFDTDSFGIHSDPKKTSMKKIFLSGLIAGTVLLILSIAGLYLLLWQMPDMAMEYFGPAFTSQMQRSILYYVHPFVIGIGLSWLWNRLKSELKGSTFVRSLKFGLSYLAIGTFPYMLLIYSAINVSLAVVATWLVFGFVEATIAAIIFNQQNKIIR